MERTRGRFGPLVLSTLACRLLAPERGALEAPVRSEIFGAARFSDHGRSLARAQEVAAPGELRSRFFPRLQENLDVLRDARRLLEAHALRGHQLAPAAAWLIDHGTLLERQFETVRAGLPRRYFNKLPRLRDAPLAGLPRIYGLAWAWVAHTDSGLDEDLLELFLSAYQSQRELTLAELWAIPTTLRVVLIENLRRLAERAAALQAARDAAHRWIERSPDPVDEEGLAQLGRSLQRRGVLEAFALQLQRRSEELPAAVAPAVRAWLATHLPDPAHTLQSQQQHAAADHQSVRNAITSLRGLDHVDWRGVLLRSSAAVADLQRLPVFMAEAEATQDLTLHDVEALARRAGMPESQVSAALAQRVLDAESGGAMGDAAAAPQYWLRGPGRASLLHALQLKDPWARLRRGARHAATPAYLLTLLAGTAMLVTLLLQWGAAADLSAWAMALSALLLALPASEAVLAVLHRLISESVPPRRLPRLALEEGIPAGERVLVVMPVMLTSVPGVHELAAQLEQHHLSNPEHHTQFALLSDFADGAEAHLPGDAPLLDAARQTLQRLNRQYAVAPGEPLRFLLLHRERVWSDSERCFMGWERKRGKLEQLLAWLAEGGGTPFVEQGALSIPAPGVRRVLTLDADTDLPPGRLRELVAIHAHPLNVPRLDPAGRRIAAGYAILQPRLVVPLPRPGTVTPFHWLFSGHWGVDPYSAASSEVYQDLFGEGTFTGKGLLDVRAVHALLGGRLPQGRVLSHDLLEGSLTRCAALSDVTPIEDAPAHPDVAASRLHRWIRGDWQLLPFIVRPWRWPMAGINRWKMADNLRRSLVAPASLLLLLWVLASGALPLGLALGLVAAAYGAGPLLGAVAALAPPRDDISLALFFGRAGSDLLRALVGASWHLLQLLAEALAAADAVSRALVRQFVTRRELLQWTTAAAAQAAARSDLRSLWLHHWRVPLTAGVLLAALLVLRELHPGAHSAPPVDAAWLLCALWAAAPLWTGLASRPFGRGQTHLSAAERTYLHDLARQTWGYYERHVGAADHHLPPDNVQYTGEAPMVAHRTSPTNIGLYLLAVAVARELGFIGTREMVERLTRTLATLNRLPRWRGHFYNWTDTRTLATLQPAYVSTVDSGNLSGSLLVLAAACRSLADAAADPGRALRPAPGAGAGRNGVARGADAAVVERLLALAAHAQTLALAADFSALYDRRRDLFHIGRDVDGDRLDAAHYDLLASEARLASLVAIAKGDVPPRHWSALARPVFAAASVGGGLAVGLKSWSGSMFEYLMPSLLLEEPAGSLLHEATRTAVAAQRADAAEHGTPWGVSESAIAVHDHTMAYQYGPQGVAPLAIRRTPGGERVIAPYASAMALVVAPQAAAGNLAALERLGARGDLGFIEALDYTPHRLPPGTMQPFTPVLTHMAHHQAMSLLGCAHVLCDGVVRRWAAQQPHLRAVLPLLHERAPHLAAPLRERPALALRVPLTDQRWQFESLPRRSALLPTHVLGNERYVVALRANGAGFSMWKGQGLTRWRDDALHDVHGLFGYVQRIHGGPWMSMSAHPAPAESGAEHGAHRAEFLPDRVLLHARFAGFSTTTTVSVSTDDDCELRQVELHNPGRRPLRLRVAMALEPTLAPQRADEAHPAFSNLFVRTRWSGPERALFLQRRPRLAHEQALHAVHFLADCDDALARVQACADRTAWLGRLGSVADPVRQGFEQAGEADGEVELDTGLDPVAVLVVDLVVPPRGSRTLSFVLAAAMDEATLRALVDRWQQPAAGERARGLSDTLARIRLAELRLDAETWVAWLHLNTLLINMLTRPWLPQPASPDDGTEIVDRSLLWRHGIGGDRPILLLWLGSAEGLDLARQLVHMLAPWTAAGQVLDLVIVNTEPPSYDSSVQRAFATLSEQAAMRLDAHLPPERRAELRLLSARDLSAAEQATLRHLSRVSLLADGRSLAQHLDRLRVLHEQARSERRRIRRTPLTVARPPANAVAPRGGFEGADADFGFDVANDRHPLRPWINVLANPDFGCQVSESAGGHTWAVNSRQHQITAGANDPLCDPPAEALWLEDLTSRRVWWLGRGVGASPRRVVHGVGHTRMRQFVDGLVVELEWCVDAQAAVKQLQVTVSLAAGHSGTPRRLRLIAYVQWTLGAARSERATLATRPWRWAPAPGVSEVGLALLATQRDAATGFGGATAFLCWRPAGDDARGGVEDWTCDRREFVASGGRWVLPERLAARAGAGLDACGAVACRVSPAPGRPAQATLLLGHAGSFDAAARLAELACVQAPAERLQRQREQWLPLLGSVQVRTPDPLFDALVNRWLPYQAIACRLWARAGYYQAGGAYGFRDQLQDAMNLADRAPQLLHRQLRLHASRQFEQGDVQHWWHPPGGAGVRTRMTDDLLWLPLALAHAAQRAGSKAEAAALLDERMPFLRGAAVPPEREDVYETPAVSEETASLFEHGARAIDHSLRTGQGVHGLPLMGTGDWNDGMNRVGFEGRGESVWLAWFLCRVIDDYVPLAAARREITRVRRWRQARSALSAALEREAWDGRWYRRAYFDDGTPLGSAANVECRIDLIAQAWAALSGAGDEARVAEAMNSARALLWDPDSGLMRLLHPPLADARPDAGYIQAYPPGIRENGGQYNHGAVWALMAFAQQGDAEWAWRMFEALSPAHRSLDPRRGPVYALEPYAIAGDIYSQPPWAGRGGWSWYTGAASWLQRAALESICGLHLRGPLLRLNPCLPPHWPRAELHLQHNGRAHRITLTRDEARLRELQAEEPGARVVRADETLKLDALTEGQSLLMLVATTAPTPPAPALARHLPQPAD
jgi:cyclic beta-1,2-glucan synthetase